MSEPSFHPIEQHYDCDVCGNIGYLCVHLRDTLMDECYEWLLCHRHGPAISLAGLANGLSRDMGVVRTLTDALEEAGRIRIVRYDGAPWSYPAIPPDRPKPNPVFVCTGCWWVDRLAVPDDKPLLDVIEGWCCTGCGQDGMTMRRLHGL